MGRRKRFTVVDSKEDREDSLKKKMGPSYDTDAKKAKNKTMKEVYDGEPEMLETLIFQEHVEYLWGVIPSMLLERFEIFDRIIDSLLSYIAYEGKGMRAVADEMKVIDLHVPKVPQQKGSTECGFMVLYFIFCFILAAPKSFGRNDYPSFKRSETNKQNKSKHIFIHCTGSKSFANIYHEEDKIRDIKLTQ
ncbi:hypothetical protein Taro_015014 [Colocasia esculenta]|uniref:Ubiquitin-like protease family profile domain-containing protein n=1 Tax=Colocasia esculenta TaxID=4460 RepID=A0A843UKX2_COLES|nr:hypothetical protein [Colocasia esculenta]